MVPTQMGKEFGWRRLLTLVGVTFALAITFQYLQIPYGTVLPSSSAPSSPTKAPGLQGDIISTTVTLNPTFLHPGLEEVADSNGFVYEGVMNNNKSSSDLDSPNEGSVHTNSNSTFAPETSPDQIGGDDDDGDPEGVPGDNVDGTDSVSEPIVAFEDDSSSPRANETNSTLNFMNDSVAERSSDLLGDNVTFAADENKQGSSVVAAIPTSPPMTAMDETSSVTPVASPVVEAIAMAPATVHEEGSTNQDSNGKLDKLQAADVTKLPEVNNPPSPPPPTVAEGKRMPDLTSAAAPAVFPISEMNKLMLQSWSSPNSIRPRWPSPADEELRRARSQIENAPIVRDDPLLYAPLYRNVSMFKRSYELMEKMLKVYVYREGERPIFHQPALKGIYASEGWFMKHLETSKKFVTKYPSKAHLFYLPFGSRNLEETLYVTGSHNHKNLIQHLKNYLDIVAAKHPFWNRTEGADHFLVACHDWAPAETRQYMSNCIRSLCNADIKEGFVFGKDSSLPETYVRNAQKPLRDLGGQPPSKRSILAFFAGNMHGYVRPILLQHWENKDPDMKIYGTMPKSKGNRNYINHMRSSKYCICPKGYEVNSPRVVEAIFHDCVPVIISDNFVPPFFEVLNWESFAVFVMEKDIPDLKRILVSIPERRYLQMQMRVRKIQQHFLWHPRPVKYDVFHMVLHSIWYNRVFRT